jgi:cytoskeletal protein RodZ
MDSEKEFKDELKQSLPIYKIAGIFIGILIMFGVIFAIVSEKGEPKLKPAVQEITPTAEPTPVNMTPINLSQNLTENITINLTNATNITINITPNATNVTNITQTTAPTPQPALAVNLTWERITVDFPSSLKRITHTSTSHHYVDIKEADGTPITNGEQFELLFNFKDNFGRNTELKSTFENSKWLISTLIPNPGNYTLILTIECADKQGHCQRRYPPGIVQKTMDFEVI